MSYGTFSKNVLSHIIDDKKISPFQIRILLLCIALAVMDGFDTQVMGFLVSNIAHGLMINPAAFGPVFAMTLGGLMAGAIIMAPLADRVGRKKVLMLSVLIFGIFSLSTAFVSNFDQLVIIRFLTGLGLGGAIPNLVALVSEYMPTRFSRIAITLIFCGMPLGGMLSGFVVTFILEYSSWRAVFIIGGVIPLSLFLLVCYMPESIEFLNRKRVQNRGKITAILAKLVPGSGVLPHHLPEGVHTLQKVTPAQLFINGRWRTTLLLWLPYSMNLLILYAMMSWVPTVVNATQMSHQTGINAIVLFSLGGVLGSIIQGGVMNTFGALRVLTVQFVIYLALVLCLIGMPLLPGIFLSVMFFLGVIVQGAQAGMNAIAAEIYPEEIRATGVGWALGAGRIGSIIGPVLAGWMLLHAWGIKQMFMAALLPGVIALFAILVLQLIQAAQNKILLLQMRNQEH